MNPPCLPMVQNMHIMLMPKLHHIVWNVTFGVPLDPQNGFTRCEHVVTRGISMIKMVNSTVLVVVFFFLDFFSGHGGDRDLERILMSLVCDGDYECAWHSTLFLNLLRQQREYDDDFHCTLFTSSSSLSPTKICTHSWRKE